MEQVENLVRSLLFPLIVEAVEQALDSRENDSKKGEQIEQQTKDRLLTTKEVSSILRTSIRTIDRLVIKGVLSPISRESKKGSPRLFKESEVFNFIERK